MQRALSAARVARAAILLAGANDQGVEFIIQRWVAGKGALKELADLFIALRGRGQVMPLEHSPGISVHHEHRVLAGIEQDRIRRFRTDAVDSEKLFAQQRRWGAKHPRQRTSVLRPKKANEAFQF